MSAVLPQANSRVLEEGTEGLLSGEDTQPGDDQLEFADLNELQPSPSAAPEDKPAADVKDKKPAAAAPAAGDEDAELPAEFRGKSRKELVKMYQEAHSTIGRQGSELGEFRRKADLLIQASLANLRKSSDPAAKPAAAAPAGETEIDDSEIFAKPKESLSKLIEQHPVIKEIRQTLGKGAEQAAISRAEQATERFNQAHPDAQDILRDPEFRQWVSASRVRRELLTRAHNRFDFDAGDEVFSTWKALKGISKPKPGAEGEGDTSAPSEAEVKAAAATLAKQREAKKAAAAAAAAAPTGGASAGKPQGGKKIFRRADVLRLMETDEERYAQLAPEIELAYREGRVR